MNNKGQAVLSEYVMIFFVVVAALVAMTVFLQRALQARINDTQTFVFNEIINSGVCDDGCMNAVGGSINTEYEPYYVQSLSDVSHAENDRHTSAPGSPASIGAIYNSVPSEATSTVTTSQQLPPECADGVDPKPSYCANFTMP